MKIAIIALLLVAPTASVEARPYFRLIDPTHPRFSAGALVDPVGEAPVSGFTSLALVTHSPEDGCLFPSVACVDWSPLAVGGAFGAGSATLGVGPSANLAPFARAALLAAVEKLTPEEQFRGLKNSLAPGPSSPTDVSVAFGPSLAWSVVERGRVIPPRQWKGAVRIFVGAAWRFGR